MHLIPMDLGMGEAWDENCPPPPPPPVSRATPTSKEVGVARRLPPPKNKQTYAIIQTIIASLPGLPSLQHTQIHSTGTLPVHSCIYDSCKKFDSLAGVSGNSTSPRPPTRDPTHFRITCMRIFMRQCSVDI